MRGPVSLVRGGGAGGGWRGRRVIDRGRRSGMAGEKEIQVQDLTRGGINTAPGTASANLSVKGPGDGAVGAGAGATWHRQHLQRCCSCVPQGGAGALESSARARQGVHPQRGLRHHAAPSQKERPPLGCARRGVRRPHRHWGSQMWARAPPCPYWLCGWHVTSLSLGFLVWTISCAGLPLTA